MSHPHADRPELPRIPDSAVNARARTANREVPRFKVVLHRDDKDLMYVVHCVMELVRFPRAEATHKMWESVHRGSSVLLRTYLERAELYAEQFAGKGLKVTIEPI